MNQLPFISTSEAIDPVFMFIFGACLLLLIGITATMITFVIRYHRSRAPEPTSNTASNLWLEILWCALPTLLVLAMFWYGWTGYLSLRNVPEGALEVTAIARQWSWSFTYPDGTNSTKLYVPVGTPVRVELVSRDVIHGFYLPAFRVKRDVVPGMKNHVWFVADRPGSYDLFCSSFCGTGHSAMITTVEALPETAYAAWQREGAHESEPPGHELMEKHGCLGCHSLDGPPRIGPSFRGIWGKSVTIISNGTERTITVDEPYLLRSILKPNDDLVKGFAPVMPPFSLTDEELRQMVKYLKELQ